MKAPIAIATFVVAISGAAGAGALDNIHFKGSDTLFEVTNDVLAACPGAAGLVYDGTGSGAGETALKAGTQTVAPMSRFLASANTCAVVAPTGTPATSEGIVVGLDGIAIVGSLANAGTSACNGATADCNATTEPNVGVAYSTTVTLSTGTYTFTGWQDVLRVVYAGLDHTAGSDLTKRDCNSELRRTIVNSWSTFFQSACSGGACTQIQHAFRRDDSSGTTDTFISLLGLPSAAVATNVTPFCNAKTAAETLPTGVTRLPADFQDNDPIRRTCAGTNNGATPANAGTEQVCGRKGDLGLVLPIVPTDFLADADAFPLAACTTKTAFGKAPKAVAGAVRCPNGDIPVFIDQCLVPVDASGSAACLAGKNTKPAFVFDNTAVDGVAPSAADGRVYNAHLHKADGTYQVDKKTPARPISGAFYRIHSTRTQNTPDATTGTCQNRDATSQIGCLVQASPCSLGFAGREASTEAGAVALKVNALEPTIGCIQSFTYPLSRKLYFTTMLGFESVAGQELALAKCMATQATVETALTAHGFVTLGRAPYCEDFNESQCTGAPANVDACTNNPAGIPSGH